ncbi:DUF58 domain-containing protein [Persicirhabdus sediminis]|uniref:DUF58 domain-containing protein n=1 Tax=Persicirhabdus sediminis TaxID=454144 RepID=A0A8J7MGD8_9BACT|nr:DUF58 domain-containing protein [Persicirhabdus sediminis]MBK1792552.1 DUF58 domain-containing protein [Persicirhabdus sediminis]
MIEGNDSALHLLELKCRRPVEHLLSGEYRSVFKGKGIEFEDVRPYQPGDDVRTMDWRVTAKTGTPHIKRFIEEREQHFYLLVDISASMLCDATGKKRDTLAQLGSLLTLTAAKNNDRVGLTLYSDEVELMIRPSKGRQHALRIIDTLMNVEPKGTGSNLAEAIANLGHVVGKRSVIFILSDFFCEGYQDELQALAHKHDLIAVNLIDPQEVTPPNCGLVRISDSETGAQATVDLSQVKENHRQRLEKIRNEMMESGVDLMEVMHGEDCVKALISFFNSRQRRVADETGG